MNLCDVWPAPWPVEIRGEVYEVSELRLCDLAALGDWVARRRGSALDALPPDSLRPEDPRAWRRALLAAYELADSDAPEWGDPEAAEAANSLEGLATFAWVALRRHRPEVDLPCATRLTVAMLTEAPDEWVTLQMAALRPDARRTVLRSVLGDVAPHLLEPRPRRADWGKDVARLVTDSGMTLAGVGELSVGQFNFLATRGEPPDDCLLPGEPGLARSLERWWAGDWPANGDGHPGP